MNRFERTRNNNLLKIRKTIINYKGERRSIHTTLSKETLLYMVDLAISEKKSISEIIEKLTRLYKYNISFDPLI